jgi:Skp family chaperone for outer membrane proteins
MARILRFAVALVFVVTIAAQRSSGQGGLAPSRPQATPSPARSRAVTQPSTTAPATVNVPVSRIAIIYSADFQDAKNGIAKYIVTVNKLNAEFQPLQNELSETAKKLNQQQAEINANPNLPPAQLQAKLDQLDQQKKVYQRKGEDAQASYQKRRNELLAPLQEEVGRALDAYAKAHGITMIIDGSQIPIAYAATSIDITKAFVAEYNSKNPVTASATAPN